jgi:hypothetical protein
MLIPIRQSEVGTSILRINHLSMTDEEGRLRLADKRIRRRVMKSIRSQKCGHHGGTTQKGKPCNRRMDKTFSHGRCQFHPDPGGHHGSSYLQRCLATVEEQQRTVELQPAAEMEMKMDERTLKMKMKPAVL